MWREREGREEPLKVGTGTTTCWAARRALLGEGAEWPGSSLDGASARAVATLKKVEAPLGRADEVGRSISSLGGVGVREGRSL